MEDYLEEFKKLNNMFENSKENNSVLSKSPLTKDYQEADADSEGEEDIKDQIS